MGDDYMSIEEPSMSENANDALPDRINPTTTPQETPTHQVSDKAVATQDMEEALAVTKTEKPVTNPATTTTKEEKKAAPTVNEKALFKSSKSNNGTGRGDGTGNTPGNQGSALGDPMASNYGEGGSGFGNMMLSIENRRFVVPPVWPKCEGLPDGKIAIQFKVDNKGNITFASYTLKGSTITSRACIEQCEQALRKAKLNTLANAPVSQAGMVILDFTSE